MIICLENMQQLKIFCECPDYKNNEMGMPFADIVFHSKKFPSHFSHRAKYFSIGILRWFAD